MSCSPARKPSEVQDLIDLYQTGDVAAGEELLSRFEQYLQKWVKVIHLGRWDRKDREVRHFLHMLGSVDLDQTAQIIARRMKAYEKADIEQEVKVTLLDTVLRYGEIREHYRFVLKKRLAELTQDPHTFGFGWRQPLEYVTEGAIQPVDINEAWVAGLTCGPGFDELTPHERRILQLTKWFGYSVEKTADLMGCSISTVTRSIRRAKKVLKIHYLD
jgi:hypothetical protein